jgi:peptidoglycan/LPS O-acetylase OafA/YrhL
MISDYLSGDGTRINGGRERVLVGAELCTGGAAVVGGLLLITRPDGSLLHAKLSALSGSPFSDWLAPGILLFTLVGGGLVAAGTWQWRRGWHARELSVIAGIGLVAFEVAELVWLGFQPLEAVFGLVGLAVAVLACRSTPSAAEPGTEMPGRTVHVAGGVASAPRVEQRR